MWPNPQFTEEFLKGKIHILYSIGWQLHIQIMQAISSM